MTDNQSTPRVRLDSLTSLRAFAALGVVLLHGVYNRSNTHTPFQIPVLRPIVEVGYLGVPFFFMLSGFVLTWNYRSTDSAWNFLRRRFARIYPLHLATAIFVGVATLIVGEKLNIWVILAVLALVQSWIPDPSVYFGLNGASWSLSCELFFYALTPLIVPALQRNSTRIRLIMVGCLMAIMATAALSIIFVTGWDRWDSALFRNPAYNLGLFVAGAVLAIRIREGYRPPTGRVSALLAVLVTGAIIIGLSNSAPLSRPLATVIAMPAIALLLATFAAHDLEKEPGWAQKSWLIRLGEWSFAVYLLNGIVLSGMNRLVPQMEGLGAVLGLLATILLINVLSGLAYAYFERPLEVRLRPSRGRR